MIRWKKRGTLIEGLGVTVADVRSRPVGCPKHASMQDVEAGSRLEHKVNRDAVEQCTRMERVREATWTHSETQTCSGSDKHNVSDGNATGVMGGCEINTRVARRTRGLAGGLPCCTGSLLEWGRSNLYASSLTPLTRR
jgi:hypothetical protein